MKRIALTLLLLGSVNLCFSQFKPLSKKRHSVNRLIDEITVYQGFDNAFFAFYAIDLNSGEVIAAKNSSKALKPGSTLKLVSTATALELLGPDFQFSTQLEYSGFIDTTARVLHGNIYIRGGGDPTLGSIYFDSTQQYSFLSDWIHAIKGLGIDSIAGCIVGDASVYSNDMLPSTWTWSNMGNYYGASACGLSIFDNYYSIHFRTLAHKGDTAEILGVNPAIPGLFFENEVFADTILYDNVTIFGAPFSNFRSIRGSLPLSQSDFIVKGSMPDPALLAAHTLQQSLKEQGIPCEKKASTMRNLSNKKDKNLEKRTPFYSTSSPTLSTIIAQINIQSINLFAEHCLIQSAIALGTEPETDIATKAVLEFWRQKGMDIQGLSLNDGSGLSNYNLITPEQVVFILQYMKNQSPHFNSFYQSLAVAGVSGTLKRLTLGSLAQGNLHGKSGTVDRSKAFAGYVTSISGRQIAFSMVVNNFSCSSKEASDQLEKLMIELAKFEK
ncbi:MAG: D-alanyl-D-alanine carboxypeptidase/D-alanyl-D-alanine-endopeptidase [Salinivirgaceae bacterium]|jgi:D-alanyl-D-alanine carboxypeptidase/D-alanyl-D-alanine-endopeptidase (penicillin-binding protein 4)